MVLQGRDGHLRRQKPRGAGRPEHRRSRRQRPSGHLRPQHAELPRHRPPVHRRRCLRSSSGRRRPAPRRGGTSGKSRPPPSHRRHRPPRHRGQRRRHHPLRRPDREGAQKVGIIAPKARRNPLKVGSFSKTNPNYFFMFFLSIHLHTKSLSYIFTSKKIGFVSQKRIWGGAFSPLKRRNCAILSRLFADPIVGLAPISRSGREARRVSRRCPVWLERKRRMGVGCNSLSYSQV